MPLMGIVGKITTWLMVHKPSKSERQEKKEGNRAFYDATRYFYLNDISLWECTLKRDHEYRWGEHTSDNCFTQTFKSVVPEIVEAEVKDDDEKKLMLRALVKLGVRMVHKTDAESEEEAKSIYTLETTFLADYFILDTPSEKIFQHFVDFNCIHNVWPFWRQHVFETLKSASLPVPSVPLFAGRGKFRGRKVQITRVLASPDMPASE